MPTPVAILREGGIALCLVAIALGVLVALTLHQVTRIDTTAAENFVGLEAAGFEDVTKSDGSTSKIVRANAALRYRENGPAVYRITLTLQGTGTSQLPYTLPISINGIVIQSHQIVAGQHAYLVEYQRVPATWNPNRADPIQLTFAPTIDGAATPLPVALERVTIAPAGATASLYPRLLFFDALLVAALWVALRFLFTNQLRSALNIAVIAILALVMTTLLLPTQLLYRSQQFGLHPKRAAVLLFVLPLIGGMVGATLRYLDEHYNWRSNHPYTEEEVSAKMVPRLLRRDLVLVFTVALGFRILWSLIVPPWQAPDEGAHFSYVAHIVESAELPGIGTPKYGSPMYSTEFGNSWNNTLYARISTVGLPRTPEFAFLPPSYDYEIARDYQAPAEERHNSAGGTATPYPPLYYLIIALPYKLLQDEPIISRLFASRIVSGIFGALGCIFGYLMAYEIRRERLWGFSIGLCMALLPMYTFVSISVNNDTAMICATTALIWTAVRAFRQQHVSQRLLWAMGLLSGCILLIKPTGIVVVALVSMALVARQWPIVRRPWRICWSRTRAIAFFIVPPIGLYSSLILLRILLNRATTGTSSVVGMNIVLAPTYSFWSYLQNEYSAGGPYFFWLFVKTFWGAFGWLEIYMPDWIYSAMLIFCAIGIVGLVLGFASKRRERRWTLLLLGLIIGQLAFLFVIADYVLSYSQLGIGLGLQGRYLFPVLAPILLLLLGGWHVLSGGRTFILYLAPFGALLLQLASLTTIITRYYGITFGW